MNIEGDVVPMLKDGTYAAWFKTPLGNGTGNSPCR
jgi:hypothetical protein